MTDVFADDDSRIAIHPTRRRVLGTLAGLAAGGTLLVTRSGDAAAVSVESFSAEDASVESGSEPTVSAELAYAFDVDGQVDELAFELRVNETTIDARTLSTSTTSLESATTLSGPLTDADGVTAGDMDVSEETGIDLDVEVYFAVLDADGGVIADATADDSATVTVLPGGEVSVGGVVTIE